MNAQDWFPLGWTGWISLQSKGLSRVFSNTTVQKYQFFGIQLSTGRSSRIIPLIYRWENWKPGRFANHKTHLILDKGKKRAVCCCSVTKLCLTRCNPKDCSMPGFPVPHHHSEFAQVHVHWISDAIQPSHSLSPLSPPAFNLSQHQSLFQWVGSSHQVPKVLELQLQHQSFQWIFRTDFL